MHPPRRKETQKSVKPNSIKTKTANRSSVSNKNYVQSPEEPTMATPAVISLGPRERYWANPPAERSWQRFWGTFVLDCGSGLYIASGSHATHRKNLVKAFQTLPAQLRKTCLEWRVTFNFAELFTASGNSSTFYGDFSQRSKELVSPHIEMGPVSLQPDYIVAHLGHELSHLFWRTRTESQRQQFRQFLLESCRRGTIEVTDYAQELFLRYRIVTKAKAKEGVYTSSIERETCLDRWIEESFCETMASLICPGYPALRSDRTVDLESRRIVINSTFSLNL